MAQSWSTKRQLLYLIGVFGVLLLLGSFSLYKALYPEASCVDKKQNQNETGIDCGGVCSDACFADVRPLITLWTRALPAGEGKYDAVGFIENPNIQAGIQAIAYIFKLYDKDNLLVAERPGKTFINPNERLIIFSGGIRTGTRTPTRAFLLFQTDPKWTQSLIEQPPLVIQNIQFTSDKNPLVEATITNRSFSPQRNVMVTATLFDNDGNVFATSETIVNQLLPDASEPIFFTWPKSFDKEPAKIDIIPRVSVFNIAVN